MILGNFESRVVIMTDPIELLSLPLSYCEYLIESNLLLSKMSKLASQLEKKHWTVSRQQYPPSMSTKDQPSQFLASDYAKENFGFFDMLLVLQYKHIWKNIAYLYAIASKAKYIYDGSAQSLITDYTKPATLAFKHKSFMYVFFFIFSLFFFSVYNLNLM